MNKNILFTLWVDGELDYHSKICIKSWIRLGYEVIVYKYEDIELEQQKYPLVVFKDAREFADKPPFEKPQEIADYFRFKKLLKDGGTWLDSDELLIKRLPDDDIIISSEHCKQTGTHVPKNRTKTPNIGVLRFPPSHPLVAATVKKYDRSVTKILKEGFEFNVNNNNNHLMKKFQDIVLKSYRHLVSEPEVYCPISWAYSKDMYEQPDLWIQPKFTKDPPHQKFGINQKQLQPILNTAVGIHMWRNLYKHRGYCDRPIDGSVFDQLCKMVENY